jgi:hypothetical protein
VAIRFYTAIALLMICSSGNATRLLELVARPTAVSLTSIKCEEIVGSSDRGPEPICMDRVFKVEYEVLAVRVGKYDQPTIWAYDLYHYAGLPDHMVIDPVCVAFNPYGVWLLHYDSAPAYGSYRDGYTCHEDYLQDGT